MLAHRARTLVTAASLAITLAAPVFADEIWVAPTYQQDVGGLGIGSNVVWPATAIGVVRLAFAIPGNLQTFQNAKIALIPHNGGASTLNLYVCQAESGDVAAGNCAGPFGQSFTGVANQLIEVDVSAMIGPSVRFPGDSYLAIVAYTTPTTTSDHIVGLRFTYLPRVPQGAATLGSNTFTGTQTAPAFVGNGAGLTNLPFPAGAATLGANTFSGTQTAPAFAGAGTALTGVAKLTANAFTGEQTFTNGNLRLPASSDTSGNIFKNGARFLYNPGLGNTFLGEDAGDQFLTGSHNVGIGFKALTVAASGYNNTAVGSEALASNDQGTRNTAVGREALKNETLGEQNTAVGGTALSSLTTGDGNVAIGYAAGQLATGDNNIYIGALNFGAAGESNAIYLGRPGAHTKTLIAGIRGKTTGAADAVPVLIDSHGQLGTISSSIRFKKDVRDMADASERLLKLRPVTFRYTQAYNDGTQPIQYGLIAEEVADVFPELAVRDTNGQVETVHYETLNVLLVNELQKQQRRIDTLEQKINELVAGLDR